VDLEDLLVESSIQLASLSRQAGSMAHNLLVGQAREELFRKILGQNLIPARYEIGNGRVVGTDGLMSREVDVIYFDKLNCPKFTSTVEIKSTLNKAEIKDSVGKISAFKQLYENEPHYFPLGTRFLLRQLSDPKPFGVIFAFKADTTLETLLENLNEAESDLAPNRRCELVVINDVGLIARSSDGKNPTVIWSDAQGMPVHTIPIRSGFKTLGEFYPLLSAMLASVPTFPVNPALYRRVVKEVEGHAVSGQIREINAKTKKKESLKLSFLKELVQLVKSRNSTTLSQLEQRTFVAKGLDYVPLGDWTVWLYDPETRILSLDFPVIDIGGLSQVRTLANACLIVHIDDKIVLVPRVYLSPENVESLER